MSLGQTTSAPASTCETAVRASSSSEASLSTSPPRSTPQWPCAVYSQRQTSVSSSSSGNRGRRARSACWTMPSAIHAPEPSSSFSSGIPNRITDLTPSLNSSSHSRTAPSTVWRVIPGRSSFGSASGATKRGITRSSSEKVVSRTRSRSAPVRRSRRMRVTGKAFTETAYSGTGDPPWLRRGLDRLDLHGDRAAALPRLEGDSLGEELPDGAADGEQRQREQRADQAGDVAAREQAEDHEQRMQPQDA